jgi:hypothetical protein
MKHNHGHIITMLGSTAVCGLGNFSDICTAKFGLVGLMESLDHELTLGRKFFFLILIKIMLHYQYRRLRWYIYHSGCISLSLDTFISTG